MTGVQTCALPISEKLLAELSGGGPALEPLVAEIATATDNALAIAGLLARITAAASAADPRPVFDSLGALLDRLQRNNQTLAQLSAKGGEPMRLALEGTDTVLARARAIVAEVSAPRRTAPRRSGCWVAGARGRTMISTGSAAYWRPASRRKCNSRPCGRSAA